MPEPCPNAPTLSDPDGTYRGRRSVVPSAAQQMKRHRRVVDRDTEAEYAAYVEQAWGTLVRAAVFLGALPHEAEDLAQTTLVRCYTGWDKVSSADNRDAYVYRMLL